MDRVAHLEQLDEAHGLPKGTLHSLMMVESAGNDKALSPAGAQGPFQFMPATAKGFQIDPYNFDQASAAAAKMMSEAFQRTGSMRRAAAEYNYGRGNVEKHGMDNLPEETVGHGNKLIARINAYAKQLDEPLDGSKLHSSDFGGEVLDGSKLTNADFGGGGEKPSNYKKFSASDQRKAQIVSMIDSGTLGWSPKLLGATDTLQDMIGELMHGGNVTLDKIAGQYSLNKEARRVDLADMHRTLPDESFLGDVAGTVGSAVAVPLEGVSVPAAGAIYGGVSALGHSDGSIPQQMTDAAVGAATGYVGGKALVSLGNGLKAVGGKIVDDVGNVVGDLASYIRGGASSVAQKVSEAAPSVNVPNAVKEFAKPGFADEVAGMSTANAVTPEERVAAFNRQNVPYTAGDASQNPILQKTETNLQDVLGSGMSDARTNQQTAFRTAVERQQAAFEKGFEQPPSKHVFDSNAKTIDKHPLHVLEEIKDKDSGAAAALKAVQNAGKSGDADAMISAMYQANKLGVERKGNRLYKEAESAAEGLEPINRQSLLKPLEDLARTEEKQLHGPDAPFYKSVNQFIKNVTKTDRPVTPTAISESISKFKDLAREAKTAGKLNLSRKYNEVVTHFETVIDDHAAANPGSTYATLRDVAKGHHRDEVMPFHDKAFNNKFENATVDERMNLFLSTTSPDRLADNLALLGPKGAQAFKSKVIHNVIESASDKTTGVIEEKAILKNLKKYDKVWDTLFTKDERQGLDDLLLIARSLPGYTASRQNPATGARAASLAVLGGGFAVGGLPGAIVASALGRLAQKVVTSAKTRDVVAKLAEGKTTSASFKKAQQSFKETYSFYAKQAQAKAAKQASAPKPKKSRKQRKRKAAAAAASSYYNSGDN